MKGSATKRPSRRKREKERMARKIPVFAALSDSSNFFCPKARERRALIPTPVPDPTAIIRPCRGNASVTAVRALSLSFETNMESTILYKACTSIEIIMGNDIETISFLMGSTPILFSVSGL